LAWKIEGNVSKQFFNGDFALILLVIYFMTSLGSSKFKQIQLYYSMINAPEGGGNLQNFKIQERVKVNTYKYIFCFTGVAKAPKRWD
jgi:ribonucleotide reductase beta subunit family protein with ferritin-like domain